MNNLNRLYWLKKEIAQIENQIKELTVLSANSMNGMPKGGEVSSSVERFYEKLEKLKIKLQAKMEEYIAEKEQIEEYIEFITDAEIRVIARARYIENKTFEQIGKELHMDRTTAYKKLKRYTKGDKV